MTSGGRREEAAVAHGARWVTAAFLLVGLLNYGYALVLTRLLTVPSYEAFSAGQGVLLWAATVAAVSVPWVLAQALARARTEAEAVAATRFTMLASAAAGLAAGLVVALIATGFTGPAGVLALALSTFVIFLGTTTMGWLQGRGRMRTLSLLTIGENLVKNAAGLLLVVVAGLAAPGALAAFGIGGLLVLAWWPSVPRGPARPWRAALASRDLWRHALGIAGVQGLVTLIVAIDVVLVTQQPARPDAAVSYQASAAVSRVPLFIASAVSTAFFPSLSRLGGGRELGAQAVRMYATVALPVTAVLMTMPAPVLAAVFPPQYAAMAVLLKYTAIVGLAAGGINIVTTFFQAADDFGCIGWQAVGLAGYVAALLAGWWAAGITGLAIGGAAGSVAALALLVARLARRQGLASMARIPLVGPIVSAGVLILVRPFPLVWLVVASGVGLVAGTVFLRGRAGGGPGPAPPSREDGGNR